MTQYWFVVVEGREEQTVTYISLYLVSKVHFMYIHFNRDHLQYWYIKTLTCNTTLLTFKKCAYFRQYFHNWKFHLRSIHHYVIVNCFMNLFLKFWNKKYEPMIIMVHCVEISNKSGEIYVLHMRKDTSIFMK